MEAAIGPRTTPKKKRIKSLRYLGLTRSHRQSIAKRLIDSSTTRSSNIGNLRCLRSHEIGVLIYTWFHDNCRMDTGGRKIKTFNPITSVKEKHRLHEMCGTMKQMYHEQFLQSPEYKSFMDAHPTRKTISFSTFRRWRCKCVREARFKVCADECEVTMAELLKAAKTLNKSLSNCQCIAHQHYRELKHNNVRTELPFNGIYPMMTYLCCDRQQFQDTNKYLYRYDCCFGTCHTCKNSHTETTSLFSCPNLWKSDAVTSWFTYQNITHENGKQSKELRKMKGSAADLHKLILSHLPRYKEHHWRYRLLHMIVHTFNLMSYIFNLIFLRRSVLLHSTC